jgi:superfamily II DNA/RNA helicase
MVNLIIPDRWQQDAVNRLRQGKDVVVDAPTGAGKTYVFELLYETLRGQAIYTVPTRALANDKLREWSYRGWDVGISTGDIAERLDARVVVATLETQKGRILRGQGPRLLVVDEYQLLADSVRGTNYELILALTPPTTQLLLLSGSVSNPEDVVAWLRRNRRDAVLVQNRERPIRLDEVMLSDLPVRAPSSARGYWPNLISRALLAELGPILIFAPRRNAAEELAQTLSSALPFADPLILSQEQKLLAGTALTKLLKNRIAFHHSGLGYGLRAGLIEPLAKNGQLRVVVATMGLAAGINFSTRSVLVTSTKYQAGNFQQQVRPDELLQMFGRAGRRGLDDAGYILVTPDVPRLYEAVPQKLRRPEAVDWPSMLAVMHAAEQIGCDPFAEALNLSQRLFATNRVPIGVEVQYATCSSPSRGKADARVCLANGTARPQRPCGLKVDGERARLVRSHDIEMKNSLGRWQLRPAKVATTLGQQWIRSPDGRWRPALSLPATLEGIGSGLLCRFSGAPDGRTYGREIPVLAQSASQVRPVKWLRKRLREEYPAFRLDWQASPETILDQLRPLLQKMVGGSHVSNRITHDVILARFSFRDFPTEGYLDEAGRYLQNPEVRQEFPAICRGCVYRGQCESLDLGVTPALIWRQLGLVGKAGQPTRRGVVTSFFSQGEGLAVAIALEREDYAIEDLIFDLANLRAGHRFSLDNARSGSRIGFYCQQAYGWAQVPGLLDAGLPPGYGAGASEVLREIVQHGTPKQRLASETLHLGDIDRAITEWRSLLRQIAQAPAFDWERWRLLQQAASAYIEQTPSPSKTAWPALLPAQMTRFQARLIRNQNA